VTHQLFYVTPWQISPPPHQNFFIPPVSFCQKEFLRIKSLKKKDQADDIYVEGNVGDTNDK
jgi:hypothetical protein